MGATHDIARARGWKIPKPAVIVQKVRKPAAARFNILAPKPEGTWGMIGPEGKPMLPKIVDPETGRVLPPVPQALALPEPPREPERTVRTDPRPTMPPARTSGGVEASSTGGTRDNPSRAGKILADLSAKSADGMRAADTVMEGRADIPANAAADASNSFVADTGKRRADIVSATGADIHENSADKAARPKKRADSSADKRMASRADIEKVSADANASNSADIRKDSADTGLDKAIDTRPAPAQSAVPYYVGSQRRQQPSLTPEEYRQRFRDLVYDAGGPKAFSVLHPAFSPAMVSGAQTGCRKLTTAMVAHVDQHWTWKANRPEWRKGRKK